MTTPVPQAVFVPPLLPTCVNGHLEVSDATPEDAQAFRPDETHYWVDTVLASIVPGLVLGIICAICMLALIVWTIVAHCRCWCATKRRHRKGGSKHHDMEDPFAEDERIMASYVVQFACAIEWIQNLSFSFSPFSSCTDTIVNLQTANHVLGPSTNRH